MRITRLTAVVLRAFLDEPDAGHYGYDLMRECAVGSARLYPILDQLERAGWVDRSRSAGPPPGRVAYRLTATGQLSARREIAARGRSRGLRVLVPGWGHR
jgi:PadR family transcriptional regulator PadR